MELQRQDWERIKTIATSTIREAIMTKELNELILERAEKNIKKFPEIKKNVVVG